MGMGELGCEGLGLGLPPGWSARPDCELPAGGADLRVRDSEVAGVNRHLGKRRGGLSGGTFLNMPPTARSLCPKASWASLAAVVSLPVSASPSLSSEAAVPRA